MVIMNFCNSGVSIGLLMFISEELLDAELPKGAQETIVIGMKSSITESGNKGDSTVTSVAEDKQNTSSVRGLQLSDRLGAKVTTGSVLDRLGVRKVTHESNLPLLRITDRLGDKIIPPETDRHGSRKVISVRSEGVTGHTDSNQEVPTPGGRVIPGNRRSISVIPQSERCNVSVAQVAPTAVKGTSRLMNVNTETEPLGPKAMHRPLDEDSITGKDQVRLKKMLMGMFKPVIEELTQNLRKLCNKRLLNVYCLPSIVKLIKSRRMG